MGARRTRQPIQLVQWLQVVGDCTTQSPRFRRLIRLLRDRTCGPHHRRIRPRLSRSRRSVYIPICVGFRVRTIAMGTHQRDLGTKDEHAPRDVRPGSVQYWDCDE